MWTSGSWKPNQGLYSAMMSHWSTLTERWQCHYQATVDILKVQQLHCHFLPSVSQPSPPNLQSSSSKTFMAKI